jgi:hypothetical protein
MVPRKEKVRTNALPQHCAACHVKAWQFTMDVSCAVDIFTLQNFSNKCCCLRSVEVEDRSFRLRWRGWRVCPVLPIGSHLLAGRCNRWFAFLPRGFKLLVVARSEDSIVPMSTLSFRPTRGFRSRISVRNIGRAPLAHVHTGVSSSAGQQRRPVKHHTRLEQRRFLSSAPHSSCPTEHSACAYEAAANTQRRTKCARMPQLFEIPLISHQNVAHELQLCRRYRCNAQHSVSPPG